MLTIRFIHPSTEVVLFDLPVVSASLDVGLNQSTRWSAEVSSNTPGIDQIYEGILTEWYIDGFFIFEGFLQDFSPNIAGLATLRLSGRSFIDDLYNTKAQRIAYYDDKAILGILQELLVYADWGIGDIGTMDDVDEIINIDLRGERNLLSQVNKLVNNVKFLYWREGEKRLDRRTLDVGLFGADSGLAALFPRDAAQYGDENEKIHLIQSLTYQIDFTKIIYALQVEGGNVNDGAERVVQLGDAIASTPALRVDPEFPIIEDVSNKSWSIVNLRDFPYPGGSVMGVANAADITNSLASAMTLGDVSSGGVETWRHIMCTFIPYPGRLSHISVRWGLHDVIFESEQGSVFDLYWKLFEVDPDLTTTLISDALYSDIIPTTPVANMAMRLLPDSEIILHPEKMYGIVFGTTVAPTSDVVRLTLQNGNATTTSKVFNGRVFNNLPINGSVALSNNLFPLLEVVTEPLFEYAAGFTYEKQQKFKPPKTGAATLAAEIQRTAVSMYNYGVSNLKDHATIKREFSMATRGSKYLPKVGDTIFVQGQATVDFIDRVRGIVTHTVTEDIAEDLRIVSYTANFQSDDITINYNLLDNEGVLESDRILDLYDQTKDQTPPEGAVVPSMWDLVLDTITISISDVLANATFADGIAAYEVTVDIHDGSVASLPINTEWVYLAGNPYGISPDGPLRIEVTKEPEFIASDTIIFLVGFQTRGWQYGDSADLTLKLVWR